MKNHSESRFDLVVIGSGPAGEKAAIQASKLGKKVALIERRGVVGGVCLHTGTIPSKTLRETSVYYSGLRQRSFYGFDLSLKQDVSIQELMHRKDIVVQKEMETIRHGLERNGITVIGGRAQFVDENSVDIYDGSEIISRVRGEYIIIAVGTRSRRLPELDYDDERIFDGKSIINLKRLPKTMTVLGGGVIGCEWACIFAKLGVDITLIDKRKNVLGFLDHHFRDILLDLMIKNGITLLLGYNRKEMKTSSDKICVVLEEGESVESEVLLATAGRLGNTDDLGLKKIGLTPTNYGLLEVDEEFRTDVFNIFAVGDVIGFPALAATSMDQGRLAARAAFLGTCGDTSGKLLPFGIYTIPEISYVGETEESLKQRNHDYSIGIAHFYELPRGQINNDHDGILKLLFDSFNRELLGVHIIGERATEIIHIGQAVMSFGGTVDYFVDTVLNFPTIAEAYKTAALNGLNKLACEQAADGD